MSLTDSFLRNAPPHNISDESKVTTEWLAILARFLAVRILEGTFQIVLPFKIQRPYMQLVVTRSNAQLRVRLEISAFLRYANLAAYHVPDMLN
ncbi:hypothetical protein CEXT_284941 [Caerostris extrusa]|uniref:Uncharacterized protein n=1 Tax=Caerostris extrusa TaxID=172846 RepID=A0AAV4S5D5_CAEEX|nr:hypothetical protein CEXT_284941 [Caerostris extrusa]